MNLDQEENDFFESEESSFDIKSIIPKIIRIWPVIIGSILIFLIGSYILTRTSVPQYQVSGLFFIKESGGGLSLFDAPSIEGTAKTGIVNEITILQSRPIAEATLSKLDFTVEYYSEGTFINNELYQNSPVLVEVNWKEPQVLQGLVTIKWSGNEKFTISFDDEDYSKYLPDGTKTKLQNIPEPAEYFFGEWITNNNFSIKVTKTSPDESGEVLG
jgi:tyrosine-protein kinase Etk/Wzc